MKQIFNCNEIEKYYKELENNIESLHKKKEKCVMDINKIRNVYVSSRTDEIITEYMNKLNNIDKIINDLEIWKNYLEWISSLYKDACENIYQKMIKGDNKDNYKETIDLNSILINDEKGV